MLDHVEQRLVRPVDILEDEHEGLRLGEPLRPDRDRPRQLGDAVAVLRGAENAERDRKQIGNRLALAGKPQPLERLGRRRVVGDARRVLDHRCERPVGDAFAVGKRAAAEHGDALGALGELADEPRLADAGLAEDRHQVGAPIAGRAGERVREHVELLLAADEPGSRDGRRRVERP